jgi:hypothetical protein
VSASIMKKLSVLTPIRKIEYSHQIERSFASSRTLFKSENFLTRAL